MVQKIQTTTKTPSEFGSRWSDVPKIKSKFQYLLDQNSDNLGVCNHVGFKNSLNDLIGE